MSPCGLWGFLENLLTLNEKYDIFIYAKLIKYVLWVDFFYGIGMPFF